MKAYISIFLLVSLSNCGQTYKLTSIENRDGLVLTTYLPTANKPTNIKQPLIYMKLTDQKNFAHYYVFYNNKVQKEERVNKISINTKKRALYKLVFDSPYDKRISQLDSLVFTKALLMSDSLGLPIVKNLLNSSGYITERVRN